MRRGYLDAMERELGVPGRLLGLGVLDNLLPLLWETQPERFPLSGVVLDQARGLIVHSHYVGDRARSAGYAGRLWRIPHPVWPPLEPVPATDVSGAPADRLLRLPEHEQAHPAAAGGVRLAAPPRLPGARLLLVGAAGERFDVQRRLERLGLTEGVQRLDYVPEERMWSLMAACDVLVNLRYPTMGETSGSVIRALSLGKPLLVSDVGWFSELPDDVVLKVPVDELEVVTLDAALEFAAEHGRRSALPRAPTSNESTHSLSVADAYVAALEVAAGGDAVDDAVLWRIAEAAAEAGLTDMSLLAQRLREVGIGA